MLWPQSTVHRQIKDLTSLTHDARSAVPQSRPLHSWSTLPPQLQTTSDIIHVDQTAPETEMTSYRHVEARHRRHCPVRRWMMSTFRDLR